MEKLRIENNGSSARSNTSQDNQQSKSLTPDETNANQNRKHHTNSSTSLSS